MWYCILNGSGTQVICYTESLDDNDSKVNSYKWGTVGECYQWVFSYIDATRLIRRISNFALVQGFDETREEWSARMYPISIDELLESLV